MPENTGKEIIDLQDSDKAYLEVYVLIRSKRKFVEITLNDGRKQKGRIAFAFPSYRIWFQRDVDGSSKEVFSTKDEFFCMEMRELVGTERENVAALFGEAAFKLRHPDLPQ